MADEQDSDAEKTEEPSEYRREEFRKRGEVASSRELNSVLILFGVMMTLVVSGVYIFENLTEYIQYVYTLDPEKVYAPKAFSDFVEKTMFTGLKSAAPCLLASMCLGVLSQVMQIGFLYAPEALQLKFDRINPINGLQRIFTMKSIVEVFKGLLKFAVIISITYMVMKKNMNSMSGFLHVDLMQSFLYGKTIIVKLGFSILLGLLIVALADFGWEKYSYRKKLMLTKQQAKEEAKEKEGNPEVKNRIRTIQRDAARKRMMTKVPKADFIVTNPTHISVAIKYDPKTMVAPEVVAKGADGVAMRIREIANQHDIPIVENIQLARTLYKTVKVGHGVPRTLYKAIAEIMAFVYRLKKKKKALSLV
ncbi:MAG: flagellar biosynthesis protein FlhB [Bacteriovoracaceae bacterium]